jgi:hypothetical protein
MEILGDMALWMRLIRIHYCRQLRNNPKLRGHKTSARRGRPSASARPAKMPDSPFPLSMNPQVEAIQAKLRQIDNYQSKGLLRADEAEPQRAMLLKKMMELVVPDTPAPTLPWRVRAWGAVAMLVLVGGFTAYLISGHAGLRARSELILAQGKIAAAQDAQSRKERMERLRRGESLAPDAYGRFPAASAAVTASGAMAGSSPSLPASAAVASAKPGTIASSEAIAPLLSGRVTLDPKLASLVAPDDTVFVTVRTPDDPAGLPLAQIRMEVSNLPFDFDVGTREMIGSPERFMHADKVVVTALVSKSGRGRAKAGDLTGQSAVVAPWSNNVKFVIDTVVRKE